MLLSALMHIQLRKVTQAVQLIWDRQGLCVQAAGPDCHSRSFSQLTGLAEGYIQGVEFCTLYHQPHTYTTNHTHTNWIQMTNRMDSSTPHLAHHGVGASEPVAWVQQLVLVRAVTRSGSTLASCDVGSRHELLRLLDAHLQVGGKHSV
jgi:hypothetical protein